MKTASLSGVVHAVLRRAGLARDDEAALGWALKPAAVPSGSCTTARIICPTSLATDGVTGWLRTDCGVDWTVLRSLAVTCCTR